MNGTARRLGTAALAVVGSLLLGGVLGAPAADAHPLGNVTVNHYHGLTLRPDGVRDLAVVDTAEIPTRQRTPMVDTDGDGTVEPAEAARYGAARCRALAEAGR